MVLTLWDGGAKPLGLTGEACLEADSISLRLDVGMLSVIAWSYSPVWILS